MKQTERKTGSIEVSLTRDFFNVLVTILEVYLALPEANQYTLYASKLKRKMLRFGRRFKGKNGDAISIRFFENEAALLIKMLTFYVAALQETDADYYTMVGTDTGEKT